MTAAGALSAFSAQSHEDAKVTFVGQAGADCVLESRWVPFGHPVPTAKSIRMVASRGEDADGAAKPVFTPDWTGSITTQDEFDLFSVIDGNGDMTESLGGWFWRSDAKCAVYNYSYTSYGDNVDDWLVTPGLNLKAGKKYHLDFYTTNNSSWSESKMEVKIGKYATVEALSTTMLEMFSIQSIDWVSHKKDFTVEEDGVYYIGFHLTDVPYMSLVFLDEISVTGDPLEDSPAAVDDFSVAADPTGAVKATIGFTLPTKTIGGAALTSIDGIKVRNGYYEIADLKGYKPGEKVEYCTPTFDIGGFYSFNVVAYNSVDEGVNVSKTLYVGLDVPGVPQNVTIHDKADHLNVTCDEIVPAHGGVFFPQDVDFNVYEIDTDEYGYPTVGRLVKSGRGVTSLDIDVDPSEGEQRLLSYVTNAVNDAGGSPNYYQTNSVVLGVPYDNPFEETFDNGQSDKFWFNSVSANGFGSTGVYSSAVNGFDTNAGCMILSAINASDHAALYSGKISMKGTAHPLFSFAMKRVASTPGELYVILLTDGGERKIIKEFDVAEISDEWATYSYDLSQWKSDRFVNVGLWYTAEERDKENQIYIDHFYVGDLPAVDLETEIHSPRQIERGSKADISVRVNNRGSRPVDSFRLRVTANGEVISDTEIEREIPPMGCVIETVGYSSRVIETAEAVKFVATATATGDEATANDSAESTSDFLDPDLATASGLKAEASGGNVILSWNPAGSLAPKTDNFESYEPWTYFSTFGSDPNPGDWTMVDVDGNYTGSLVESMYYGSQGQQFAFTVFNPYNYDGYGQSIFSVLSEESSRPFIPHSGEQYLAAVYGAEVEWDGTQYVGTIKDADNWMISPEQIGQAQTITFYVNNYKGLAGNGRIIDHAETFEVLYSTSGKELEDFVKIGDDHVASGGKWQKVSIDLPEGTRHFAIRHCSTVDSDNGSPFILMVDDVTYFVANKPVEGYNLYRDGVLVTTTAPEVTTYVDGDSSDRSHFYQVTVKYQDGTESSAVSVDYSLSGLDSVLIDAGVTFDVYTATGALVRRGTRSLSGLPSGIYVTSRGDKVIVR